MLATVAAAQHGVVARRQLLRLGMTPAEVSHRLASGRLHPLHRGVYAVGHVAIGRRGQILAAVLACGAGAVASHRAAAELHGIYDRSPVVIDITPSGASGRKLDGVSWHRPLDLDPADVTVLDGIPLTNVSRTLVDLAGMLGERSLRDVVEAAAVRRSLDAVEIDRILARGRRRGAPALRRLLQAWRGAAISPRLRSLLEARLLAAIAEAQLPRPECNVLVEVEGERFEIDLLWRDERLVVETDGEETHRTALAFQRDRRRDQVLVAAGYRTVRVTWRQMDSEPEGALRRIEKALRRGRAGPS